MKAQETETRSIAEQAAEWLIALETPDDAKATAFMEWMKASPLHVRELLLAADVADVLRHIDPERRIDPRALLAASQANVRPMNWLSGRPASRIESLRRSRTLRAAAIAAGVAMLAFTALFSFWRVWQPANVYATDVGEQRMFELPDGSVVFINARSKVQIRYTQLARDLYLRNGQALFRVRRDTARPFRVHAAAAIIQALGTQFDVRLDAGRATVAVVEGAVQVSTTVPGKGPQSSGSVPMIALARVEAGQGTSINAGGAVGRLTRIDPEAVSAWRQQRLIFRDTPLRDIVEEFNRYNRAPHLRVEGDRAGAKLYNGSFAGQHPESFLNYIAQQQDLLIERQGDEVVIRARD